MTLSLNDCVSLHTHKKKPLLQLLHFLSLNKFVKASGKKSKNSFSMVSCPSSPLLRVTMGITWWRMGASETAPRSHWDLQPAFLRKTTYIVIKASHFLLPIDSKDEVGDARSLTTCSKCRCVHKGRESLRANMSACTLPYNSYYGAVELWSSSHLGAVLKPPHPQELPLELRPKWAPTAPWQRVILEQTQLLTQKQMQWVISTWRFASPACHWFEKSSWRRGLQITPGIQVLNKNKK